MEDRLKYIDLFAGAGGFSQGIKYANAEVALGVDNWGIAAKNYRNNFENIFLQENIGSVSNIVSLISDYDFDVIVGGPPCQDFSSAGKGVEGERANLTLEFSKIVSILKPKYFIMENVPNARKSNSYQKAKKNFLEGGYGVTETILDANYYGVPQRRKRLFLIGALNQPDFDISENFEMRQTIFPLTVKEYMPDISLTDYYLHPRSYERRGVFSVYEPSPTIRGVNRPKPKTYVQHIGNTNKDDEVVSLSYDLRSRIQTFPKEYHWVGNISEIEQMIGNAVPPLLAKAVVETISNHSKKEPYVGEEYEFYKFLQKQKGLTKDEYKSTIKELRKSYRYLRNKNRSTSQSQLIKSIGLENTIVNDYLEFKGN
ncbi:DNA (cytosine-5-)-methyltransferase [Rothia amarae]|uniref:DNA cytosine methyltransferase n=1 Tax=Rothia amarae TaxID=169480 RepID=UPI0031D64FA0